MYLSKIHIALLRKCLCIYQRQYLQTDLSFIEAIATNKRAWSDGWYGGIMILP